MNDLLGQWKKGISLPAQYSPSFLMNVTHLSVRSPIWHWYHFLNFIEKGIVKYLRNAVLEGISWGWSKSKLHWMQHKVSTSNVKIPTDKIWLLPFVAIFAWCWLPGRNISLITLLCSDYEVWLSWHDLHWCAGLTCSMSVHGIQFFLTPHWVTLYW